MGDLPFEKFKREVLTRVKSETSLKFGCDPYKRPIKEHLKYCVVNVDKPAGPSSHQVSAYVKQILKANKAGHSGTLDPNVTGILAVAVADGTRIVQTLLPAGKEYICLMHLHKEFDEQKLRSVIEKEFTGKIKQLPPVKSAIKRQWRFRKIYYFEILEIVGQDVLFKIGCQAGTYIRKICSDIGGAMGCGGHMAELRRTKAGPFNEFNHLCTLQDLTDAMHYLKEGDESKIRELTRPVEEAVAHLPKIWVQDTTVDTICNGASLKVRGIAKVESDIQAGDLVAVMTLKNELVCVGICPLISKELIKNDKGVAVKSSQVFMRPGTYPRIEKNS
ncbi:MAG: RNA-guided pseudouridylation complex pseudouridine synthase subunit Cbf5 [Candidatus Nanoarchaeia archaeon]|nr:RNA-guided pseudouridylation complex pseudouridine synthase subunit Cbf5 [Candidatus Nanoarchaeia archaeon]